MKEKILLEQMEIEMFKIKNYEKENIGTFITELKKLEYNVGSDCENKAYGNFAGNYQMKFLAIYEILMSKKLQKNKEDLKKLGQYVQELGKEIENYEETIKKYETQEKTSSHEKIINEFIKSFINELLNEEE